jgi:hypothetical protein
MLGNSPKTQPVAASPLQTRFASYCAKVCLLIGAWSSAGFAGVGDKVALDTSAPKNMDPAARDRFLGGALPSWRELRSRLRDIQLTVDHSESFVGANNKVTRSDRQWTFCLGDSPGDYLVLGKDGASIYGANRRYSFELRRKGANNPYQLTGCVPWAPGESQPYSGGAMVQNVTFLDATWSVWWVPLDYILAHDGFKLVAAEGGRTESGDETVKVAFRYDGSRVPKPLCAPGTVYWAEMLPRHSWVVLRSGLMGLVNGKETLNILVSIKYNYINDKDYFPSSIQLDYEDVSSRRLVESRETRLSVPAASSHVSDEFYLPHYGIAESSVPPLTAPSGKLRWVAILLGAAGIILASWLMIASRTRRKDVADKHDLHAA